MAAGSEAAVSGPRLTETIRRLELRAVRRDVWTAAVQRWTSVPTEPAVGCVRFWVHGSGRWSLLRLDLRTTRRAVWTAAVQRWTSVPTEPAVGCVRFRVHGGGSRWGLLRLELRTTRRAVWTAPPKQGGTSVPTEPTVGRVRFRIHDACGGSRRCGSLRIEPRTRGCDPRIAVEHGGAGSNAVPAARGVRAD